MKKFYQRFFGAFLAVFTILFLLIARPLNAEMKAGSVGFVAPQNIEITFDYPDQIKAGTEFLFSINIKHHDPLLSPGNLSVQFTNGFYPVEKTMEGIDFHVKDNTASFSWGKLTDGNIFFFSFPVKTAEKLNGVYPVRIVYRGEGKEIKENAGLYIVGKVKTSEDLIRVQERFSPVAIQLNYPEEVLLNTNYEMTIEVAKGKNTGGADIIIRIPPASNVFIDDTINYIYKPNSGKIQITIKNMPPNPAFSIKALVQNNSAKKAVYPVSAKVFFDNNTSATFADYIYLTDKITSTIYQAKEEAVASNEDFSRLEATFSELDKLLQEWTASTIGDGAGNNNSTTPAQNASTKTAQKNNAGTATADVSPEEPKAYEHTDLPKSVFFTVQIAASLVPITKLRNFMRSMQITEPLMEDFDGEYYRYIVGEYAEIDQAKTMRLRLISKGFSDAFVVKYQGGIRQTP